MQPGVPGRTPATRCQYLLTAARYGAAMRTRAAGTERPGAVEL